MKTVREPCAGDPQARFDERRGGNGSTEVLGERTLRKHRRVVGSDLPADTAPPADSTFRFVQIPISRKGITTGP